MIRTWVFALLALSLQANAAVVSFTPSTKTVTVGETFTLSVDGSEFGLGDMDGGSFDLVFNSAVLNVLKVDIDPAAWDFEEWTNPGTIDNGTPDNHVGTVTGTQFAQFTSPKVDAFHILSYQFLAVGTGISSLWLIPTNDPPFSSGGAEITPTFLSGSVNVTAVPEPSTAAMLIGGLLLVAFGASRRLQ